uniref:hypothetical protein n=1 Tax=Pseudomonas veronii TaxID=76761 RepID=UPI003C7E9BC1
MSFDWHLFWNVAPAWIQAIGSILALVAVILASKIPVNHAASEKRRTIFAIVEAAHSHACNIRKAIDAMGWPTGNNHLIYQVYNKVIIESVVRALQGVPTHELGSSKAVLAMLSLTDQMVFLGSAVETLLNGPLNHPEIKKALESIDQNDHAQRLKLGATGFSVLQSNARGHLDQVDKEYESLKGSLKS